MIATGVGCPVGTTFEDLAVTGEYEYFREILLTDT